MADDKKIKQQRLALIKFLIRYSKISYLLVVVVIIILGYYFIIAPKYEEVSLGGQYSIETLTLERDQKIGYAADLRRINRNYREINSEEVKKLDQVLPEEKDIPGLFVQFQALAAKHDFQLLSINISEDSFRGANLDKSQKIKRLNISLNLTGGDYSEFKEFLESIELNLRIFDINATYFTPGSDSYSLNLFTYYLSE